MIEDIGTQAAASLTSELVSQALQRLYRPLADAVGLSYSEFSEKFEPHYRNKRKKCQFVRTIIAKDRDLDLETIYVPARFSEERATRLEVDVYNHLMNGGRLIVRGNGGSGKTFFVKNLFLTVCDRKADLFPILLELRNINSMNSHDLTTLCRYELGLGEAIDDRLFRRIASKGRFIFILDGLDEVSRDHRTDVERQILELESQFQKCSFIVTSRGSDRFPIWSNFLVYDIMPMELDDTRSLIKKIPFNESTKNKFLTMLSDDVFEKHQSFLSSPLLSQMMLISYHDNNKIPSTISSFYEQAFNTLLVWHYATKNYERSRAMAPELFRKFFSAFCFFSYNDYYYEFTEERLSHYIEKSLQHFTINVDVKAAKADLCEAVNVMALDGLKYTFIHRSFQEYFTAYFLTKSAPRQAETIMRRLANRRADTVLAMANDINSDCFIELYLRKQFELHKREKNFVVPGMQKDFPVLDRVNSKYVLILESQRFREKNKGRSRNGFISEVTQSDFCDFVLSTLTLASLRDIREPSIEYQTMMIIIDIIKDLEEKFTKLIGDLEIEVHVSIQLVKSGIEITVSESDPSDYKAIAENLFCQTETEKFKPALGVLERHWREAIRAVRRYCEESISDLDRRCRILDSL